MTVTIKTLGVEVPGQVVRKYDKDTDTTAMVLNEDQARQLHEEVGTVVAFFDTQTPKSTTA